jgi:S1-C subfamily serine protease
MLRVLVLAIVVLLTPNAARSQAPSVLHIKVALVDADGKPTPVPRHALLISSNPASAPPQRVVTGTDGAADVPLRPGSYTVESERPVAFHGKAYDWTQIVEMVAGRDTRLDLTAENADAEPLATGSATAAAAATPEADPSFLLPKWQHSVVGLWTPHTHGSGFVIDAKGLIATNQRAIRTATAVEVQLSPAVKVAASVVASDPGRDIAILWIDPKAIATVRPLPLACGQAAKPAVASGQEIFTIGVPLRQEKGMSSATVSRVEAHALASDLVVPMGSTGGPVFTADGTLVGITSAVDDADDSRRGDARVLRAEDACDLVASAEKKMKDASPPSGAHLPVDPERPFPVDALKQAAERRPGNLTAYQLSASIFDVTFITPVLTYTERHADQTGRDPGRDISGPEQALVRPLADFSNWSDYVDDFPPVLLIRVTPKLVEGFWTTVARGAAMTQGVALPPIKHFKSGFSRMRAFCGDAEVVPIHPFRLEQRVSETDAIYEGLYAYDASALGPQCGTVKLVLYPEKEPDKGDTRVVDPTVVQRIWQDFEAYRLKR